MSAVQFDSTITDEIKVTPEAAAQLKALVDQEEDIEGVRIFVAGGGCGGMNYGMTFVEAPEARDCTLVTDDGLKVFVDAVALDFLKGVEIDYQEQGLNRSFVFRNAFQAMGGSGTCGTCGAAGGGCG